MKSEANKNSEKLKTLSEKKKERRKINVKETQ